MKKRKYLLFLIVLCLSLNTFGQKRNYWVSTYSGLTNAHYGLKAGIMGEKLGLYSGVRLGQAPGIYEKWSKTKFWTDAAGVKHPYYEGEYTDHKLAYAFVAGLTTNLYQKKDHRLILQTGLGIGRWYGDITERDKDGGLEWEVGFQYWYKRFIVHVALNHVDNYWSRKELDGTIGFGLRF